MDVPKSIAGSYRFVLSSAPMFMAIRKQVYIRCMASYTRSCEQGTYLEQKEREASRYSAHKKVTIHSRMEIERKEQLNLGTLEQPLA